MQKEPIKNATHLDHERYVHNLTAVLIRNISSPLPAFLARPSPPPPIGCLAPIGLPNCIAAPWTRLQLRA